MIFFKTTQHNEPKEVDICEFSSYIFILVPYNSRLLLIRISFDDNWTEEVFGMIVIGSIEKSKIMQDFNRSDFSQ